MFSHNPRDPFHGTQVRQRKFGNPAGSAESPAVQRRRGAAQQLRLSIIIKLKPVECVNFLALPNRQASTRCPLSRDQCHRIRDEKACATTQKQSAQLAPAPRYSPRTLRLDRRRGPFTF